MAKGKILYSDVSDEDVYKLVRQSAAETLTVVNTLTDAIKSSAKGINAGSNGIGNKAEIDALTKSLEDVKRLTEELNVLKAKSKEANLLLSKSYDELTDSEKKALIEDQKIKLTRSENLKATKELAKEELDLTGAYKKKSDTLNKLREEYKNLAAQNKSNTKEAIALKTQVNLLDSELKHIDATVGQHQRSVGNYEKALSNLPAPIQNLIGQLKALGVAGVIWKGLTTAANFFYESTERGSELMERRLAGMNAAWGVLKSQIIGTVESIDTALENSGKKTDHWYTNVTAAASAFIQNGGFGTGFTTFFNAQKVVMNAAATAAENYTGALQDLEDLERAMIVPRAERNREIVKARELIYDETKSLKEKIEIVKQVFLLESIQAEKEVEHQKKVVEQIEIANAEKRKFGLEMDADDMKLQQARAKVIELETQSATRTLKLHREIHKLEMDMKKEQTDAIKEQIELRNKAYEDEKKNEERMRTDAQKTSSEVQKGYEDYYQRKSQIYRFTAIGDKHFTEKLAKDLLLIEKEKLETELKDENISAADKLEIQKRLMENSIALKQYEADQEDKIAKKREEALKARIKKEQETLNTLQKQSDNYFSRKEKAADMEIQNAKDKQQTLALLAQKGVENAAENYAFEQKVQAEAEEKRLKLERNKMRAEFAISLLKAYSNNGGDLNKTLGDSAALIAAAQALPQFYEGTEDTGTVNKPLDKNGGRLAVIHDNERILNREQNMRLPKGLSNEDLVRQASLMPPSYHSTMTRTNGIEKLESKLDSVVNAINNIEIPQQQLYWSEFEKGFIHTTKTRDRILNEHHIKRGLF